MEVLTLYVGQGNFAIVRHSTEAIAVDTRWLAERSDRIASTVNRFLQHRQLVGIVLTGLDDDHADPAGLDWLLENYTPAWVMYPKYFKDTENAALVFNLIRKHEQRRKKTQNPLKRVSVRLDRLESRYVDELCDEFELELFSPHIEDMDSSNNCGIVLKMEGIGPDGFAYLATGDTEIPRWDRIVELFDDALAADVLAAPHHGSKDAAHAGMALAVTPNTVLISAGVDNQYGHPDAKARELYLRVADHVFQTNARNGISLLTKRLTNDFLTRRVT
jgi:beta-lactamase superfamily II metal-dependent hydrolase